MSDLIKYLSECRGSGTSVVSFHIPQGASIQAYRSQVASEIATAPNIKDKTNRHSVITALKSVQEQLTRFRDIPETGFAIFAGECF